MCCDFFFIIIVGLIIKNIIFQLWTDGSIFDWNCKILFLNEELLLEIAVEVVNL